MRQTRLMMGMPITVEVVDTASPEPIEAAFDWFAAVDARYSPYRDDSELTRFNRCEIAADALSAEMRDVLALAEQTKWQTGGYFDIRRPGGGLDPSGIVKGWAIARAAERIGQAGFRHYYVDAGGDVQCAGHNDEGQPWQIGIRNPFNETEIVKVVALDNSAIATSGNYVRGPHIYNPVAPQAPPVDLVSLTVLAPDVYDADRFATAAYAMGRDGIGFIEQTNGLQGYAIDTNGMATMTSGFKAYLPKC